MSKCPVYIKLIAPERLLETAAQYDLEYIPAVAAFDSLFYKLHILVIRQVRRLLPGNSEGVGRHILTVNERFYHAHFTFHTGYTIFQQ